MRVVICGWPGAGKSTFAKELGEKLGVTPKATDAVRHLGWSECSEEVSHWFDEPGPWIVEGIAVPRALRKWHERNPDKEPPFEKFYNMRHPNPAELKQGQSTMGKGHDTVLRELEEWLGALL